VKAKRRSYLSSSQPAIKKPQAILVVYWRERQCNIVIDTEKDQRGIQEIITRGKKVIRDMIVRERSQPRRPR
jgi:hypothetical protein